MAHRELPDAGVRAREGRGSHRDVRGRGVHLQLPHGARGDGGDGSRDSKAKAEANGGRKGGGGADAAASRVDEITRTAAEQNAAAAAMATFVPEENSVLAALGVKTLLKMLIDDNFLHADSHPGNILVRLPGGMRGGMPGGAKDAKEGRAMDDDDAKKDASSERNGGNGNGKAATKGAGLLPKVRSGYTSPHTTASAW